MLYCVILCINSRKGQENYTIIAKAREDCVIVEYCRDIKYTITQIKLKLDKNV